MARRPIPHERRHRGDPAGLRGPGAHVAREDERERQGDGRRGTGEVHGERQRALVGGGEAVGERDDRSAEHHGGRGEDADEAQRASGRAAGGRATRQARRLRRRSTTPRCRRRGAGPRRSGSARRCRTPTRAGVAVRRRRRPADASGGCGGRRGGDRWGRRAASAGDAEASAARGVAVGAALGEAVAGAGVGSRTVNASVPRTRWPSSRSDGPLDRVRAGAEGQPVERHDLAAVPGRLARAHLAVRPDQPERALARVHALVEAQRHDRRRCREDGLVVRVRLDQGRRRRRPVRRGAGPAAWLRAARSGRSDGAGDGSRGGSLPADRRSCRGLAPWAAHRRASGAPPRAKIGVSNVRARPWRIDVSPVQSHAHQDRSPPRRATTTSRAPATSGRGRSGAGAGRRSRRSSAAAVLFAVLVAIGAPAWTRLILILPLWGGAISWLQARRHFCVAYAMGGLANFGDGEATRRSVVDPVQRAADRRATVVLRPRRVPARDRPHDRGGHPPDLTGACRQRAGGPPPCRRARSGGVPASNGFA